jgi:hypothetical protein
LELPSGGRGKEIRKKKAEKENAPLPSSKLDQISKPKSATVIYLTLGLEKKKKLKRLLSKNQKKCRYP